MNGEILFLAHRLPFPPDRGDKIRSHYILKALASLAPVHVGCLADNAADRANEWQLAEVATSHFMPDRRKSLLLAGFEALLVDEPVSATAFRHPGLAEWIGRVLKERPIDTIYVFSGQMGQYVPPDWTGRLVVDLCDVDSAKFEQYAAQGLWPRSWIYRREGQRLRTMEERLARIADRTLLISEPEADFFRSRLNQPASACVTAMANGIDAAAFDPAAWKPRPELVRAPGPHIVFTGQMDYAPNIAAVKRVASEILPSIRLHHPQTQFHVVGRAPTLEVRSLESDAVKVWGEVPAVQPFLVAANLVVAPLVVARGVQNKVLEAMAMACPVLLTSYASTGIDALDGTHFAVADENPALIHRALALLADRPRARALGTEARRFVTEKLSWEATLANLPTIVGHRPLAEGCRDAA